MTRTLDAGTDKPLPFLTQTAEANPALGIRGYRTVASYPHLLSDQLIAIKEAADAESAEIWVMAPMISTTTEARSFARVTRAAGLPIIGVMIQTPAAALEADFILTEVDFVSIGTNDLAQYVFAADRGSAALAALNDPWQPALLHMIEMVTSAAAGSREVGVCGEAAAIRCWQLPCRTRGIQPFDDAVGARRGGSQSCTGQSRRLPQGGAGGLSSRLTCGRPQGRTGDCP